MFEQACVLLLQLIDGLLTWQVCGVVCCGLQLPAGHAARHQLCMRIDGSCHLVKCNAQAFAIALRGRSRHLAVSRSASLQMLASSQCCAIRLTYNEMSELLELLETVGAVSLEMTNFELN